jgi:glycosyltransferase involved in cell wall biosynthesis
VTAAGFFQKSLQAVVYNARYIPDVLPKRKEKQNNLVFGFIGTLSQSKGIEWLLSEFKKIDSLTISLKIAGKGDSSYENSLKDIAEDDKRICFLGVCKPEVFYPAIDVLVVPSIWEEPLGMVAIEACAYHVPVITSGQGGLKEIIKDGYNGLYCDVDDPSTLYTTMIKIIDDCELLNKLCKNARASIRFFLDTDRLISGYEEIYRKLIVKQDDFPCKKQ